MADERNVIKINPQRPSEIEFDVMISGLEEAETPVVRFVLEDEQFDKSFKCGHLQGSTYSVKLPKLTEMDLSSVNFRVEVLVDGYYFEPAQGEVQLVKASDATFRKTETKKPSVTASFKVKQDVEEAASGGPQVTGQYAPNNGLLKPEENPTVTQGKVKTAQAEVDDLSVDKEKLGVEEIVPGEGNQYHQEEEEEFDPAKVAENILKQTTGDIKSPERKGSLFKRDAQGKPIVPGLESPDQKKKMEEKSKKVKDILKRG